MSAKSVGGCIVVGEMPACFDDLAQSRIHAFDGVGGVDDAPYLGRESEEGNHLLPSMALGPHHGGKLLPPGPSLKGVQFSVSAL